MNTRRSFLSVLAAGAAASVLASVSHAAGDTHSGERTTGEYIDDKTLEAKVKSALIGNDQVKARNVEVEVRNGVVHLGGTVDSAAEAEAAVLVARRVEGVKSVQSALMPKPAR
ncbi:BON domain-containing protein [Azoarcus indigens]|uniref:Hyperosmotically inducible protein n=1 Tax=Azoarcus indigens TaxID=29545 RepID=A0A4R6ECL9_9RHOO|nr:BON domain-containing protein [Azoarcus indigens]NMG65950.1 BON domain-containing protein [Azoarcus indigens]TDN55901.1 hyperosmotically inducible protein [Azoarcus indigens]